MISRIADALTHLAVHHRRAVFWGALALAVLSVIAASRLRFNPDILSLIPQNDKEVNDFREVLLKMGLSTSTSWWCGSPPAGRWTTTNR